MKNRIISILLITIVFVTGIGLSFWSLRPPAPPSENDPDFNSYSNMLTNIETMTQHPHPSGSQELADVRAYLLAQLDEMGVTYDILETVCSLEEIEALNSERRKKAAVPIGETVQGSGTISEGEVILKEGVEIITGETHGGMRDEAVFDENDNVTLYNILVKLDAPNTDRGVLFMAHYDSEFEVPGACDDMTGVCALLETVRRHSQNNDLKNDLYFLFTDGEELGGMGARVFVRDNPGYHDIIDLVVNLDARGTSGGLLMFETSAYDYEEVAYFKAASKNPITYSWLPMVYRSMSNGTDLTSFLDAGYAGLNFAVVEGVENYSSPTDDIEHLNHGTAYNFVRTAFEMSDYAASVSLGTNSGKQDGVYFTLLPGLMILMSGIFARILAGFAAFGSVIVLIWQWRRGGVKPLRTLTVSGLQLGIIAASALLGAGVTKVIQELRLFQMTEDIGINTPLFLCVTLAIGIGVCLTLTLLTRKRTFNEVISSSLLILAPLTFASAVFFNAMSYLFTLPLLGLLAIALFKAKSVIKTSIATLVSITILLLYTPVCWLLYMTLGFGILALVMAMTAFSVILIVMLHKKV